jgi:hypothetical protein
MGELYRRPIDEIEHAPIAILSILRFTDYAITATSESNILKSIYNKMILIMKMWSTTGTRDRDGGTGTTTRLQHGLQAPAGYMLYRSIVVAGPL